MNNIKYIFYTMVTVLVGIVSYMAFRKIRKLEEMYDDALDAKAHAKLQLIQEKVRTSREAYAEALKKYNDSISDNEFIVFTIVGPFADAKEPVGIIDDEPTVPRSPKDVH